MTNPTAALAAIHRYPVKSMMGEELNAAQITTAGLFGDRSYALCDAENGKVVSAKNPRKWPGLFRYRATYVTPPESGSAIPPVRVTLPDGTLALSSSPDFDTAISSRLGRSVTLLVKPPDQAQLEEFWPDREASAPDAVTDEAMPPGTFFDLAILHILTTGTLNRLSELEPRGRFEPRRFRPNLILDTGPDQGFVENEWVGKNIAIGPEVVIQVTGPCPRCVMTTLPQGDLPGDPAILKTAGRHNQGHVGIYGSVARAGTVRVGDTIRVA